MLSLFLTVRRMNHGGLLDGRAVSVVAQLLGESSRACQQAYANQKPNGSHAAAIWTAAATSAGGSALRRAARAPPLAATPPLTLAAALQLRWMSKDK